ncbi:DUF3488 and transglutaminase-like domain-containing protein [Opitutus sp. ER46]|uniref:transglutaminase family protein n=1 Tax=Opitutus sp. ER46 TaxID=2161864 RepID=UPI000D30F6C5|nr:DUF3488 and transglutaminase-like domain-containing protein [Opitutus sp. ER46]PTX97780.1 hypothetical protein DB354_05745 [Opitutus sp. ER46]
MTPARPNRPQLTLDELHQLRWLLGGLLTVVSVGTVVYMAVDAWLLMGLTVAVAVVTTLRPSVPARVPRLLHVMAFPSIAAFFALDFWLTSELLPALVRLDILLLLYRSLGYRQKRDDLQVIMLGLFLVVVAGVLTVSIGFALQLLLYTAGALGCLLLLTLIESTGAAAKPAGGEPAPAPPVPPWAVRPQWRRLLGRVAAVMEWRVVALGLALFGGVIVGAALLFLLIPRFQLENGMFLDRFITKKARTGFSDTIRFGEVTEIQQDTSVALHIDVAGPEQIPLAPYWRMLVLDDYRDGTFRLSPALRARSFGAVRTGTTVAFGRGAATEARRWRVYLEPGVSRYLPLLGRFRELRFAEAQTYQWAAGPAVVALAKDPVTMTAFQVEGFDAARRLNDDPAGSYLGRPWAEGGAGAEDRGKLERFLATAGVTAGMAAPQVAERITAELRARHSYTLSPRVPGGRGDPLVRWLDSREAGHCELFAGACVLLARTAGYPARVVTGFRGGTWNAFSESFTVRNSDAHAWAEIFDPATRAWLRADPLELPTNVRGEAAEAAGLLARRTDRSWGARMESLRVFWYRRVVSFDERAQVQTLKVVKEVVQDSAERLRQRLNRSALAFKAWLRSPWDWRRVGAAALVLALGGAVVLGWRRLRWRWLQWAWWRPQHRDDPIRREAGRWLRRLAERRGAGATTDVLSVVADLRRLRFGPRGTWPVPEQVFRRARAARRTTTV